jgi:hypothetical protein
MNRFISKEFGDLQIECKYYKGCAIVSQGQFILRGYDTTKEKR